jgi:hypothetical protein
MEIKIRKLLDFVIITILLFSFASNGECIEKNSYNWKLTGHEVLLELSDPKGELSPGIYAWDPAKSPDLSNLRLLVKAGHHPIWSPHYKKIAYLFNGDIWIADKEGNGAAAINGRFSENVLAENQVLRWTPDGKLYFTRQSPIWGSAVYVSPVMENVPMEAERELYNMPYNFVYSIRPRKEPQTSRYQPIQTLTTYAWKNILASNNASFSPDGNSVALEIYPAFDQNLLRGKSVVHIYKLISDSVDAKKLTEETKSSVDPWFRNDEATPRIKGPGHPLLPNTNKTQIKPIWSPNDEWIAVTIVDTENPSMFPVITRLDGTIVTKINTLNFGEGVFGELTGKEWNPANFSSLDQGALKKLGNIPTVFRKAIAWSDDGKYLWMQEKNDGISVAKETNGQWYIKNVKSDTGDIAYKPAEATFNGDKIFWLEDSGDLRKILNIHIFDAETDKTQTYSLRSALKVLSVDW